MKKDFINALKSKFFIRFHMSLILFLTFSSAIGFSKLTNNFGWTDLTSRYLISFLFSYLVFLLAIRIWLWYVIKIAPTNDTDLNDIDFVDAWIISSSSSPAKYRGNGGSFSGGGASSSWGSDSSSKTSAVGELFDGVDEDSAPLFLVIGIVLFLLALVFGGFYLIFEAPMFLGEIAFDLALSAGIIKNKSRLYHPVSWLTNVFKKTIIPVVIICILIIALGLTIKHYNPEITTSLELFNWLFKN